MLSKGEVVCIGWWSLGCSEGGGLVGKLAVAVVMLVLLRPRSVGFGVVIVGFGWFVVVGKSSVEDGLVGTT